MIFKIKMVLERFWNAFWTLLITIYVFFYHKITGKSPEPVSTIQIPRKLPDVIPEEIMIIHGNNFQNVTNKFFKDTDEKMSESGSLALKSEPKNVEVNVEIGKTDSTVYRKVPDKPEVENLSIQFSGFADLPSGSQEVVSEHSTTEFSTEFPKALLSPTQFEEQVQNLKIQHRINMDQMKLESAENLKKSYMKFREKLAKDEEENEKELRELDREIEEFEKETRRIIEEKLLEIRKMNLAFFQCLLLQRKWEMDEKKFSKFLDSIREPISRLKARYSLFEKVLKTQKRGKKEVLKRELTSLHGSTYYAYQSVYEGWENIKKLSETFSDRIFLFILLKTLVNVSDKLFNILNSIDNFMNRKRSLEHIREEFSKLEAMDIPQTCRLREQSEIEPLDTLNFRASPRFYKISSSVKITEV
ncbi:hypothetical protein B9Z55_008052 [Caenorhabditis nigoni]|nr:hypothetical protein B9Z55_008052 [Caenorhabditis nigoni]